MSFPALSGWRLLPALLLLTTIAHAEPNDEKARALAKEAMDGDYLSTNFKGAEKKLKQALQTCAKKCSATVVGELHRDLAIVYLAGLKQASKGKAEMSAALEADPELQLHPDYTTPEVEKAFVDAGGVKKEPGAELPEPEQEPLDDPAEHAAEPEPEQDGSARRHWLSLVFQQDLLSFQETTGVCSGAAQYQCFLQGETYTGPIYEGSGNQLQGGLGIGTRRVLLGYEHALGGNLTVGGRLGFAFGGSPKATSGGGTGFLPVHAELRANYWFGEEPLAREGFRPYVGLAGGIAEVDAHVAVEYFTDEQGYRTGAKGKLDAWRKTGNAMLGLQLGTAYALAPEHALLLELRLLQMLGATALGGAVSLGYTLGL